METSDQEKGVDQETLSAIDTNISRLLENKIGKAIIAGGKKIGYIVSFTDRSNTEPREDAFGIFSDGVMSVIDMAEGAFGDKFNAKVQGNEEWVLNENMNPADFRKRYSQNLSANDIWIRDSTDSKSPQSVERVMSIWNSTIKPEIAKFLERKGAEVINQRVVKSAKTVAEDLKGMFNLPETPAVFNGTPVQPPTGA